MLARGISCLAAISAKRRKIPIFHMEAGNRCFDQRVPEEINRVIVDHISDINMPYSTISRDYLLREGLLPDRIIKMGGLCVDIANAASSDGANVQLSTCTTFDRNSHQRWRVSEDGAPRAARCRARPP